jgi:hypothetical protein
MASYDVTLTDHSIESVEADAYEHEGPMTTFFELGAGRHVVDCWARRVASIRTADIVMIRRAADAAGLRAVG